MELSYSSRRRGRFAAVVASLGIVALGLTACSDSGSSANESEEVQQVADVTFGFEDGATGVSVTEPVTVSVENGEFSEVEMTNEDGKVIESDMSDDGTSWSSAEPLGYSRTYTVTATADGKTTSQSFTTVTPAIEANVSVSPLDGSEVGVGQTIAVRFGVSVEDREAVEDAIEITTEPSVDGAFYWLSNSEVRWRPQEYWEPGTKVQVKTNTYGLDLGNDYFGASDQESDFTIGDRVIARVDDNTKTMSLEKNGEVLRTVPVSLGRSEWATPNGTYMVGDRHESLVMDSSTFGLTGAGAYRIPVNYATQMSYSGIYIHGAPWSVWAQGSQNTSHGCINVTDADAKWFQENLKRGDIVTVENTVGPDLPGVDGLGDWNIPWSTWSAGNANPST